MPLTHVHTFACCFPWLCSSSLLSELQGFDRARAASPLRGWHAETSSKLIMSRENDAGSLRISLPTPLIVPRTVSPSSSGQSEAGLPAPNSPRQVRQRRRPREAGDSGAFPFWMISLVSGCVCTFGRRYPRLTGCFDPDIKVAAPRDRDVRRRRPASRTRCTPRVRPSRRRGAGGGVALIRAQKALDKLEA